MSIDRIQARIQRENQYIDKKYKGANTARRIANTIAGGAWLGVGCLGAKSITKEKSILRDAVSGVTNFTLKHLNNSIKHIDKKQKLTKVTNLLQKAKEAPAKTKALVVFGAFIAGRIFKLVKENNYLKGVLNQAKVDEKVIRANQTIEDEAVKIAQRKELLNNFEPADLLEEN